MHSTGEWYVGFPGLLLVITLVLVTQSLLTVARRTFPALLRTAREEGVGALYKGTSNSFIRRLRNTTLLMYERR